jgi:hypothetical protein
MLGASGEVVAAASSRLQTLTNAVASTSGGSNKVSHPRHAGLTDQVGQARLPLSFGLFTTVVKAKNSCTFERWGFHLEGCYAGIRIKNSPYVNFLGFGVDGSGFQDCWSFPFSWKNVRR